MPIPEVLESLFAMMKQLLDQRIPILVMTKAKIPARFFELFAQFPRLVNVQIGLTTANDRVRALIEPNAAVVEDRLQNISSLVAINVKIELRMDPLIPMLTDTDDSLRTLLQEAARRGCRQVIASFLHVRPAFRATMSIRHGGWDFDKVYESLYSQPAKLGGTGSGILLPSTAYRQERVKAIKKFAAGFGITTRVCACKNPDLAADKCLPNVLESDVSDQLAFSLQRKEGK